MIKLTVAIITYNEENNIGRCISSVTEIADEILVVDSFSTDKTKDIAESMGASFVTHVFAGHIEQKNYALSLATHDFVLSLDADEALSLQLLEEIKAVKNNFTAAGYTFPRLTNYNGAWIKHSGWYPDLKLRLVNKKKARWGGVNPHDILKVDEGEKIERLKGDLLHYSYDSIFAHVVQTNKFTSIAAQEYFARGTRSSYFKIITRPFFTFLKDYFLKRGFMDGRYGLIICLINGFSTFLKYAKIHELQNGKKI